MYRVAVDTINVRAHEIFPVRASCDGAHVRSLDPRPGKYPSTASVFPEAYFGFLFDAPLDGEWSASCRKADSRSLKLRYLRRLAGAGHLRQARDIIKSVSEATSTNSVQPVAARGPDFLLRCSTLFYQSLYISDICIIFFGRQGLLPCWSGPVPSFCPCCFYCSLPRTCHIQAKEKASAEQAMLQG